MLEGLDKVDWSTLWHSYGPALDTPGYLRKLASADAAERTAALIHLIGAVNHQTYVNSVTAVVVPFLLELLAHEEIPSRGPILRILTAFVESCNAHDSFVTRFWRAGVNIPFGFYRNEMETYLNVSAGVDLYLSLLKHPDSAIRRGAAVLIGELPDQAVRTHAALWEAIENETDDDVLAEMLDSFPAAVPSRWNEEAGIWKRYVDPLEATARTHRSAKVRLRAALALILLHVPAMTNRPIYAPPFIVEMVVDALVNPPNYGFHPIYFSDAPLIRPLARLGFEVMATALKLPGINARAAHLIAREMLDQVFNRGGIWRSNPDYYSWGTYEMREGWLPLQPFKGTYRLPKHDLGVYELRARLTRNQQFVLEQIAECDPFWEQKTNLFSFFYGLPDEREDLRRILREQPQ